LAVDASTVGAEAKHDGPPVLSILASAALFIAAMIQLATLASRFLLPSWPQWSGLYDIEFQPISGVLAVVVGIATLLRSRTARTMVTGVGLGGLFSVALWPPWAMLDTEHPVPAWTGFFILVLMAASLAAGWREQRISTGRNLVLQVVGGGAIGWVVVYAVLILVLMWVVFTSTWTM
jgi:hypothetical protein